jgi:hypothetical protein
MKTTATGLWMRWQRSTGGRTIGAAGWLHRYLLLGWFTQGLSLAAQPASEPVDTSSALSRVSVVALNVANPTSGGTVPAFQFSRTGDVSQPLTVRYLVGGGGTNGVHYERLPGRIVIPAGLSSADTLVRAKADGIPSAGQTVSLQVIPESHPFSLVILPDTQYYVFPKNGGAVEMFRTQMEWIARQKDVRQIEYVLHLGDITEYNSYPEWARARSLFGLLDGVLPYAISFGNHDGIQDQLNRTQLGNAFFKTAEFETWPTYGGVFETNRMDNSYHLFTAGGIDWMVLSLEYGPRNIVLDWANTVVAANSSRKVIVITHAHVFWDNTLLGSSTNHVSVPSIQNKRQNDPPAVWDKFLRRHPNMFMVLNGHSSAPGNTAGQVLGTGDAGNRVYQFLSDYQFDGNGGGGYLRTLTFKPETDGFEVASYSPFFDRSLTNSNQSFSFTNTGVFRGARSTYLPALAPGNMAALSLADPDAVPADPKLVGAMVVGTPPTVRIQFDLRAAPAWVTNGTSYRFASGRLPVNPRRTTDPVEIQMQTNPPLAPGEVDTITRIGGSEPPVSYVLTNSGAMLLADFSSGDLSRWKAEHNNLFINPPLWRVADQRLYEFSGNFSPAFSANDNRRGPMLVWNDPAALQWTSFSFGATVYPGQMYGFGLVFHYRDTNNFYKVEVDFSRRFHKLTRRANGVETLLAQEGRFDWEPVNIDWVIPTRMRVEVSGDRIEAFLGSYQMFGGAIVDGVLPTGTVGLYGWANRGIFFDDVVVAPVGSVAPAIRFTSPTAADTTLEENALVVTMAVDPGPAPITSVRVLDGGVVLTNLDQGPYQFNWTNIAQGMHSLSAVVTDAAGNRVITPSRIVRAPQPWPLPVFVREPIDVTVTEGQSVTLYARAIPRGLSYQWYFNGSAIPHATNKLCQIANMMPAGAGVYRVQASSGPRVVSSRAALVTVNPAHSIPQDPPPGGAVMQFWDLDPEGWIVGWLTGGPLGRWQIEKTTNFNQWSLLGETVNQTGASWFALPMSGTNSTSYLRGRYVGDR